MINLYILCKKYILFKVYIIQISRLHFKKVKLVESTLLIFKTIRENQIFLSFLEIM